MAATCIDAREAVANDLAQLVALARAFVAESDYGWTFSELLARHAFETRFADKRSAILVTDDAAGISGGVMVAHDREFHTQRIGYIEKLYVYPRARGTRAGRALIEAADLWFRDHLVWSAFATATAGVGQDQRFVNLLGKVGFRQIGPTLLRDYAHG